MLLKPIHFISLRHVYSTFGNDLVYTCDIVCLLEFDVCDLSVCRRSTIDMFYSTLHHPTSLVFTNVLQHVSVIACPSFQTVADFRFWNLQITFLGNVFCKFCQRKTDIALLSHWIHLETYRCSFKYTTTKRSSNLSRTHGVILSFGLIVTNI